MNKIQIPSVHTMTETEKQAACRWRYPTQYDLYNLPAYEKLSADCTGFCNPEKYENYRAFYDADTFIGYTNLYKKENFVFIGIGVSPDMCSKGYGQLILEKSSEIAGRIYAGLPMMLEVRTWNTRAIACYSKSGYEICGRPFTQETGACSG